MNFAALGAIAGTGQGIREGAGTLVARRKEELERRRLEEKDQREERRLDLAEQRAADANRRALMSEDMDFILKGGRIVRANGTEHIGHQVGVSTASTQPSEYDVDYEDVGSYNGATYQLPKDRLTPAERLKQRGRVSRRAAASGLPYYKPTAAELDLLDDPEQGDQILQSILNENRTRDPAGISARARSAGEIAAARFPFSATANRNDPNQETPAQRNAGLRSLAAQERTNESQSRQEMREAKPLNKKDYGWVSPQAGFISPEDSLRYEKDNHEQFGARQRARMEAAQHGFSADSATREIVAPQSAEQAGQAKLKAIYDAYVEAHREAKTPEERAEALELYEIANERALREMGRMPTRKKTGGGGSSF
jgi:hypothetical protein